MTPVNTEYLLLGLTVVAVLVVSFLGLMMVRYRNLLKDEETVQRLLQEEN